MSDSLMSHDIVRDKSKQQRGGHLSYPGLMFKISYDWSMYVCHAALGTVHHRSTFFLYAMNKVLLVYVPVFFFPSVTTYKTIETPSHDVDQSLKSLCRVSLIS
tara:strand:+ start:75 stop:383 length:309 start_codon:yes stop_codon:yes gene_type:complete